MNEPNFNEIREAYNDWLQHFEWDYFFTATFRHPRTSQFPALRAIANTLDDVNKCRAFIACEPHTTGELHLHGLIKTTDGFDSPTEIWRALFKRHGRAKVERIRSKQDTVSYCAKYVTKYNRGFEYAVHGSKELWRV